MKAVDNNKRDEILSCILNRPEDLTAEDVQLIKNDEELRDLYNLAVLCKEAIIADSVKIPDVEAELVNFKATRKRKVKPVMWFTHVMRVAAVFVGVVIVSLVVVAIVNPNTFDFAFVSNGDAVMLNEQEQNTASAPVLGSESKPVVNDKMLEYDNVSLETIIGDICEVYGCEALFKNENARTLRLYLKIEEGKTIGEVVAKLNTFDFFSITLKGRELEIE